MRVRDFTSTCASRSKKEVELHTKGSVVKPKATWNLHSLSHIFSLLRYIPAFPFALYSTIHSVYSPSPGISNTKLRQLLKTSHPYSCTTTALLLPSATVSRIRCRGPLRRAEDVVLLAFRLAAGRSRTHIPLRLSPGDETPNISKNRAVTNRGVRNRTVTSV
jgi:hypothetical protein